MPATGLLQPSQTPSVHIADVVIVVPGLGGPAEDGATGAPLPAPPRPAADVPPPAADAPGEAAGLVRVDRGRPTPEELAAVVTVLLARAAAPTPHRAPRPAPRWLRQECGAGVGVRTARRWQLERSAP